MSEFRTTISMPPSGLRMGLNHRFLTLGSCFSDAIGRRLKDHKFFVDVNPFGVIYNPVSIHRALDYAVGQQSPPPFTFVRHADVFLNHDFHSSFSSLDPKDLHQKIREVIDAMHVSLRAADFILMTYGTAWVYYLKNESHLVANCHKKASAAFEKKLLSVAEIVQSFTETHKNIRKINPAINIILTVSPVRHIKDTLPLNQVSKSVIRLACHELAENFAGVEYFPAYELMMDDLRDYRFYKDDMLHPTEQAEDYIWRKFVAHYMYSDTQNFIDHWNHLRRALNHKAFHANSSGHKIFLKDTLQKLEELQSIVNVDEEINAIKAQLDPSAHKNIDS